MIVDPKHDLNHDHAHAFDLSMIQGRPETLTGTH